MPSKIIIPGGSGFLGQVLRKHFEAQGKEVFILTRNPRHSWDHHWDGKSLGEWTSLLEGAALVINLAGKSVNCRYTEANKKEIVRSRVDSTQILGKAIQACETPPLYWMNASSATIYTDRKGDFPPHTESQGMIGEDFSMNVAKSWEKAFFEAETPQTKKGALRISFVLGNEGGALPVVHKLALRGLNTTQGPGNQMVSWLHIQDFLEIIDHIYTHQMEGAINVTSPSPITNRVFYQSLRSHIRPFIRIPQPVWMLKLGAILIGTETELILKSRNVYPERLIESGYSFHFPEIEEAFSDLLST
ncbi:MAG: TIGR01777 family oxidoreductase [Bacteroidota bacterium]